jgi:hypothetical protein
MTRAEQCESLLWPLLAKHGVKVEGRYLPQYPRILVYAMRVVCFWKFAASDRYGWWSDEQASIGEHLRNSWIVARALWSAEDIAAREDGNG